MKIQNFFCSRQSKRSYKIARYRWWKKNSFFISYQLRHTEMWEWPSKFVNCRKKQNSEMILIYNFFNPIIIIFICFNLLYPYNCQKYNFMYVLNGDNLLKKMHSILGWQWTWSLSRVNMKIPGALPANSKLYK